MVAHVLAASIFGSKNLNIYVVKTSTVIFLLKFFKRQFVVIVDKSLSQSFMMLLSMMPSSNVNVQNIL